MLVEIPRLELQILPFDMRDTLRRIGLKSLFNAETADFSKLTEEKIHLSAVAHACTIKLVESTVQPQADASLENAPERFTLSRPHIWIIADLETDTPIEFMCLVEEMLNS
jgi:serine protease inhibitor